MTPFRDMPVKQKLLLSFLVTIVVALLLAGLGVVATDSVLFYRSLQSDLFAFARVIADNSTAALAFEDPAAGAENLAVLEARTHVIRACLYRADGTILARYRRTGETNDCPEPGAEDEIRSSFRDLTVSRVIHLQDRRVGTLVLLYDLSEFYQRMRYSVATVLIVLLIASMVALLFSSYLRAGIVSPILQLVKATTAVSQTRDYSIRAQQESGDEIGMLARTFNEMLAGIQERDRELREALALQDEALKRLAELNADLNRSNVELARTNDDLERFAFVASHDLQEPLRMVTLYSQLLVQEWPGELNGKSSMYSERVLDGTRRMRELLTSLLAYAEIAGSSEKPAQPVDLNVVLEKVQENLRLSIEESRAVITSTELPKLNAYEGHVLPLFQNLIANALKYHGPEPPNIHIAVERQNGNFQFAVSDNGIGIDPEYHSKIFVAFKRLHGRKIPGTGIGLAICQRVVERYGGRIWVESQVGKGATFFFTLPASEMGKSHV